MCSGGRYVKDSQYNLGQDRGWLDQVIYTTNPPISLGEALDICGAQWWTGGNSNPTVWAGDTSVSHDGRSAARSGAITTSQESTDASRCYWSHQLELLVESFIGNEL